MILRLEQNNVWGHSFGVFLLDLERDLGSVYSDWCTVLSLSVLISHQTFAVYMQFIV